MVRYAAGRRRAAQAEDAACPWSGTPPIVGVPRRLKRSRLINPS